MTSTLGAAVLAFALGTAVPQQGEELRKTLKDVDLVGTWIYDNLPAGYAAAKKSGKPMLVVFR